MSKANDKTVVLVDSYHKSSNVKYVGENKYKDFRIHALPGLHEYIASKVDLYSPNNASLLDLAAGSGAMTCRLLDHGYTVTSADIVPENFQLKEKVDFVTADFNEKFANNFTQQFDGIIAVEIIEHIENPRNFLRECYKLLKPNGIVYLTTPNLDNPVSKALFIRTGTYQWFNNEHYKEDGHITPITQWYLNKCIEEVGYEIKWNGSFGDPFEYVRDWKGMRLFAKFIKQISNIEKKLENEILVYALKKPI